MDFYYAIKNLDDEQLEELITMKIDEARYHSQKIPFRFIGVDCGINPIKTFYGEPHLESQAMWQGFIPEDVKIIYSFVKNDEGYTVNNGCYYYIDNHDYIYEFAKYIKKQEIKDENDFLSHVYFFIDNYFNSLSTKDIHRMLMHKPLLDMDGNYIEPTINHNFSDFKGANNAECSEYSVMAQNILSIFDYTMVYFGGSVNSPVGKGGHAFNFTLVGETPCIIDFTIPVNVYDLNGKLIKRSPFLGPIQNFSTETLRKHILEHIPYEFSEFFYLDTGITNKMISTGEIRNYVVGNVEYYNQKNQTLQKSIKK